MWELEEESRSNLSKKEKNKKKQIKQLIHNNVRVKQIKQEYNQEQKKHEAKYANIFERDRKKKKLKKNLQNL
jgi:outer membrane protein assembly factor BamE (lipoprotein component of BamABCDE complex)